MDVKSAVAMAVAKMGFRPFSDKQSEAVETLLAGNDTFVILPTGHGKSLIYAVLPMVFDAVLDCKGSIVVVITPLVALMIDQTNRFQGRGITVEFVGEAQVDDDVIMAVISGKVQLVYISPENILTNYRFRNMICGTQYQENMKALVIDEAHCIKLWGQSFRKVFHEIGNLRSLLPKSVNVMALTATVTKETLSCVVERLSMKDPKIIGLPPNRENIKFVLKPSITKKDFALSLASELLTFRVQTPKTVVFCTTVQQVADIFSIIKRELGIHITEPPNVPNILPFRLVDMFTAGSTSVMRQRILAEYCKKETKLRLIIATSAFGLGVDCPDITRVINWGPPPTLEDLLQQSGRAGRDGTQSEAILYYVKPGQNTSSAMQKYGTDHTMCRRELLYQDFLFSASNTKVKPCLCCDVCELSCTCTQCKLN